jgi:hypothetical protein
MADLTGILRGYDLSHHNDVDAGRLQGDFVIARTAQARGGQYGDTLDRLYKRHRDSARRAGKLFSSYFYVGDGRSAEGNVALHESVEPDRGIPVMLDWEKGSGNGAFLETVYGAFGNAGYFVWGLYAPRWYWQSVGSPDLSWGPPLIQSRYADMQPGSYENEYRSVSESWWGGYGNNSVKMLQFSSTVRDPAYPSLNLDGDAFKGSRAALADWWNPHRPNPTPDPVDLRGVEIMETVTLPASPGSSTARIKLPGGPSARIIVRPRGIVSTNDPATNNRTPDPVWMGHIYAWGDNNTGVGHDPVYAPGYNNRWDSVREWALPGALWADVNYSCKNPVDIDIVG